ncbi:carbonic anhydrase [Candidatus Poseidoniaceae archaeon]|nr:carbonic anhydrase [Candidatus Poseidoniaceae archaeon]
MTKSNLLGNLISQNQRFSAELSSPNVPGVAGKELLILTCMDSRIVPHQIFGLNVGDVKVVRNAGGQLNPEVEKDIILATHLLNCRTIIIMPHTKCAMTSMPLSIVQQKLTQLSNKDFSNFKPRMIDNAEEKLKADVKSLQSNELIDDEVEILGAIYDVDTGVVNWLNQ